MEGAETDLMGLLFVRTLSVQTTFFSITSDFNLTILTTLFSIVKESRSTLRIGARKACLLVCQNAEEIMGLTALRLQRRGCRRINAYL